MLLICENPECGTRYAVGLEACPYCGSRERHEQRPEDDGEESAAMAKIGRDVGPSNVDDPAMPPVLNAEGERFDRQDAEATDEQHVSWTDQGRESLIEGVVDEEGAQAARTPGDTTADETAGDTTADEDGVVDSDEDLEDDTDDAADEFDPNQHTVAEVNEYLGAVDDPAERDRVIAAERAGRNRSGIRAQ